MHHLLGYCIVPLISKERSPEERIELVSEPDAVFVRSVRSKLVEPLR